MAGAALAEEKACKQKSSGADVAPLGLDKLRVVLAAVGAGIGVAAVSFVGEVVAGRCAR